MNKKTSGVKSIFDAGFSAGKWRMQLLRLTSDQSRLEKQKSKLISELGARAWEAKVTHPGYQEIYTALLDYDQKRSQITTERKYLENTIQRETEEQNRIRANYSGQINDFQTKKKAAETRLNQARSSANTAQNRFNQLVNQQQKGKTDLNQMQAQLTQVRAGAAPDKEARMATLLNGIKVLGQSNEALAAQLPEAQAEIYRQTAALQPIQNEIAGYDQEITKLQARQKEALDPIDKYLAGLREQVRSANEAISRLSNQMQPLIAELGPKVLQNRPQSAALTQAYAQIDAVQTELTGVTNQADLLKARLQSIDAGAMRNFYLLVGGGAAVLVGLIVVISLAVIFIPRMVTGFTKLTARDPKTDVRLDYTWSSENCSPDQYLILNVWENKRTNAVAEVTTLWSLIGANDTQIDSGGNVNFIGPGGKELEIGVLQPQGSRVINYKSSVSSINFYNSSLDSKKIIITPSLEKIPQTGSVNFILNILNRGDFGLEIKTASAIILDKNNKPMMVMEAARGYGTLAVDQNMKMIFYSNTMPIPGTISCSFQEVDFANLPAQVTVWYFVTLGVPNNSTMYVSISNKVPYAP